MPRFAITEQFACAPQRAFAAVTDFAAAPGYVSGIDSTEILTPGPLGVGSRIRETRTLYGRSATEEMEISAWDPPRSAVIEARSHGAHYVSSYTVTPRDGGAEVRLVFEARPLTLSARLLSFLTRRMFKGVRNMMIRDLREAKLHAESG